MAAGQDIENLRASGAGATTGVSLTGNEFNNYLIGGSGSDMLMGGAGNDRLNGGAGADAMYGGIGNDIYYVDNAGDQVFEATNEGNDTVFASTSWAMTAGQSIEGLRSNSALGLSLTGNEFANTLIGGAGNDTLDGGLGNDRLTGGGGNDTFLFDTALGPNNVDRIGEFSPGSDTIALDHTVFSGLTVGQLSASAFSLGSPSGTDAQIVYNQATGALFYDANGTAGSSTQFATVAGGPALDNTSFKVV
jgi:Ca2+-binding RTX toxin-like protein